MIVMVGDGATLLRIIAVQTDRDNVDGGSSNL